jgi:hypothetical protein
VGPVPMPYLGGGGLVVGVGEVVGKIGSPSLPEYVSNHVPCAKPGHETGS